MSRWRLWSMSLVRDNVYTSNLSVIYTPMDRYFQNKFNQTEVKETYAQMCMLLCEYHATSSNLPSLQPDLKFHLFTKFLV